MNSIKSELQTHHIGLPNPQTQESVGSSNKDAAERKSGFKWKIARKFRYIVLYVRESLVPIRRVFQDHCFLYVPSDVSNRISAYQVWPGNNVFFFHGRLVCGPDPRGLLLTVTSIILSSWIFSIYIGSDLGNHSTLIVAFSLILTIIVLVILVMVSGIDPGIIPRNDQESEAGEGGNRGGTRRKRITVNGVELKLKYCRICKIFRPPRSCHCAICNNCVEKFDHHSPWIGQCIALRNYRFFLMFVLSALVFFVYVLIFSFWRLHQRMLRTETGFSDVLRNSPETLALVLFTSAAIWFLAGLAIFHFYLIAINQTSYENFRQLYVGSGNPYDRGIISNIKEVMFVPMSPSKVDFRAQVTERSLVSV